MTCVTPRCERAIGPAERCHTTKHPRRSAQTRVDDRGRDEDAAPSTGPDAPGAQAAHAHGGPVVTRTVHGDEAAAL